MSVGIERAPDGVEARLRRGIVAAVRVLVVAVLAAVAATDAGASAGAARVGGN